MRLGSKRICSLFLIGSLFCVSGYADPNGLPKAAAAKAIQSNSQNGGSFEGPRSEGVRTAPFRAEGKTAERPEISEIRMEKDGFTIKSMVVGTGKNKAKVALVSRGIYALHFEKGSDFFVWNGASLILGEKGTWILTAKNGNTVTYNPLENAVILKEGDVVSRYSGDVQSYGSVMVGDGAILVVLVLAIAYEITHAQ